MALEDIINDRVRKLENFEGAGVDPFPAESKRSHFINKLISNFEILAESQEKVIVAGRIIGLRNQGNIFFADLKDGTAKIQFVTKKDDIKNFELYRDNLDIGDFVQVTGALFTTQKGEKSIQTAELKLLAKSLRPLPDQWSGLSDIEIKLRKRYLDLLSNEDVKEIFKKKAIFWDTIRNFLKKQKFLEVEMPVFESIPGGADAEPFITHHNALDQDFYLRISLELPLKKLLVGGYEKVFEIGRVFRNEGIDAEHLQDYTAMEFYSAYQDYKWLMKFVEKLYKLVIKNTTGGLTTDWQGHQIDWSKKWPKIEYYNIFKEKAGIDLKKATEEQLAAKARELGLNLELGIGKGRIIDLIYKKTVRPILIQPCFLINPPVEVEPLAKKLTKDEGRVARIQVVAAGTELGKGFSELNDPIDQRHRFMEQMRLREQGDKEAQRLDEDFLEALNYGMPPAAGFGLSERFFAILMNKPVRETVIFPLMRPK
ncbi:MAG: lysine--tRNA ligase [Patescibacteria group bacterium]|mgnify:CR=1